MEINSVGAAALMDVLRLAVESRKAQLVDIALDLIQKLIAHKHIQGPISSISHKRDPGKKAGRRRLTEDEDDLESVTGDDSLPQVIYQALCYQSSSTANPCE